MLFLYTCEMENIKTWRIWIYTRLYHLLGELGESLEHSGPQFLISERTQTNKVEMNEVCPWQDRIIHIPVQVLLQNQNEFLPSIKVGEVFI